MKTLLIAFIQLAMLCCAQAAPRDEFKPPVGIGARLPASYLKLMDRAPCTIEDVVVAKPHAKGGKEINLRGDYLFVCYWVEGDKIVVVDQLGKWRFVPSEAFYPITQ